MTARRIFSPRRSSDLRTAPCIAADGMVRKSMSSSSSPLSRGAIAAGEITGTPASIAAGRMRSASTEDDGPMITSTFFSRSESNDASSFFSFASPEFPCTTTIDLPRTPPDSLISFTATLTPATCAGAMKACAPVTGKSVPIVRMPSPAGSDAGVGVTLGAGAGAAEHPVIRQARANAVRPATERRVRNTRSPLVTEHPPGTRRTLPLCGKGQGPTGRPSVRDEVPGEDDEGHPDQGETDPAFDRHGLVHDEDAEQELQRGRQVLDEAQPDQAESARRRGEEQQGNGGDNAGTHHQYGVPSADGSDDDSRGRSDDDQDDGCHRHKPQRLESEPGDRVERDTRPLLDEPVQAERQGKRQRQPRDCAQAEQQHQNGA